MFRGLETRGNTCTRAKSDRPADRADTRTVGQLTIDSHHGRSTVPIPEGWGQDVTSNELAEIRHELVRTQLQLSQAEALAKICRRQITELRAILDEDEAAGSTLRLVRSA